MKSLNPRLRESRISKIIDVGDGLIILETIAPENKSNLYKVGYDFSLIWEGELRTYGMGPDVYNGVYVEDNMLVCPGSLGDDHYLDPKTGKIIKSVYTK